MTTKRADPLTQEELDFMNSIWKAARESLLSLGYGNIGITYSPDKDVITVEYRKL